MSDRKPASDYTDLEVWQLARELSIKIHLMTIRDLPKFEMYETGSQIRRSSKSIRFNIVEGYGRKKYKLELLRHLDYALGSARETQDQLHCLNETGSLANPSIFNELSELTHKTIGKLQAFIQGVEKNHRTNEPRGTL